MPCTPPRTSKEAWFTTSTFSGTKVCPSCSSQPRSDASFAFGNTLGGVTKTVGARLPPRRSRRIRRRGSVLHWAFFRRGHLKKSSPLRGARRTCRMSVSCISVRSATYAGSGLQLCVPEDALPSVGAVRRGQQSTKHEKLQKKFSSVHNPRDRSHYTVYTPSSGWHFRRCPHQRVPPAR